MADIHPHTTGQEARTGSALVPGERRSSAAEREMLALRQRLEAMNRSRAEFLSKMSHEFRTPMTSIVGMTDLLLLGEVTSEQRECLSTVRDAADALMALLNDVCDYARVEAGILDFEWSGFRLRTLIEEVVARLATSAREKGIEVLVRVARDVPELLVADPHRMEQVLFHMLDSSIRLTTRGSVTVEVNSVSEISDEVILQMAVRDTGSGIALEDQPRMLEPFLGVGSTSSKRYPLAPLGLPLAASLAAAMGGQFHMTSDVGSGSCFQATLRLLKQNRISAGLGDTEEAVSLRGCRALLVDESSASRDLITEQFELWGIEATAAASVAAAVEQLLAADSAGEPFDFILLDALSTSTEELDRQYSGAGGKHSLNILSMYPADHDSANAEQQDMAAIRKPIFDYQLWEVLVSTADKVLERNRTGESSSETAPARRSSLSDSKSLARCEVEAAVGRLGGDVELYKELVQCFLDDTSDLLPRLRRAVVERDAEGLHRAAHSLKGLAASCGAQGVAEAAGRLERLGREKIIDDVDTAWSRLERTLAATRQELAPYYPG